MSKTFRAWDVDQEWLLPPSVHDFVPAGHLAHFVRETVREGLDLSAIQQAMPRSGYPPGHPGMMVALLLYAYSCKPIRPGGLRRRARSGWTSWR